MRGSAFFDTNALLYAFSQDDPRAEVAEQLLGAGVVVGVQTLNEMSSSAAVRKLAMPWPNVLEALQAIQVVSSCRTFYTEDLNEGQAIDGQLTIRNPFRHSRI